MTRTRTGNRRVLPAKEKKDRRRSIARVATLSILRLLAALTVVCLTFGGVIAGYLWLTTTSHLAVRDVRFIGNERAQLSQLIELARIRAGTNLLLVDVSGMEQRLVEHPWVRLAHVRREWPGGLTVSLEEYVPRAIAVHDGLYLVDAQGVTFMALETGSGSEGLPVITGLAPGLKPAQLQESLLESLAVLDAWNEVAGRRPLAEIHRDPVRGVSLTLAETESAPPMVAHLGQNELESRLARLDHLLLLLSERGEDSREVFVEGHTRPQWVVARVE